MGVATGLKLLLPFCKSFLTCTAMTQHDTGQAVGGASKTRCDLAVSSNIITEAVFEFILQHPL